MSERGVVGEAANNGQINQLGRLTLLAAILISAAGQLKYAWFIHPFQIDEHRAGLEFFAKNRQPGDVLFVHHSLSPTVGHSVRFFPEKYPFGKEFVQLKTWQPDAGFLQKEVENWRETHPTGRVFIQWPAILTDADRRLFRGEPKFLPVFSYKGGQVFEY